MASCARVLILVFTVSALLGVGSGARAESRTVILSTTTSTQDSGLLDVLVPLFERATGYTVFVGTEPKPFELEILGVLKGFPNPQQSAVLAKLLGDDLKHTGVFQGMSGSPVYIDGKLLGAVAFGYLFAKDPIAGITPIQHMIDVFEQKQGNDQKDQHEIGHPRSVSFSEIAFNENSREFEDFVKSFSPAGRLTNNSVRSGRRIG